MRELKYKFITFEGIEGSGKSTQSKNLHQFLLLQKINCVLTREPGGVAASENIRKILLDEEVEKLEAKTELLLNFAARVEHVEKLIKPALKDGKIVICDRFFDSSYAYQGSGFGMKKDEIDEVKKIAIGDFQPDVTFLIDVPVETAFKRIESRKENNRYEKLSRDFHEKIRAGFLEIAKKEKRVVVIDGSKSEVEIFEEIKKNLEIL